VYVGSSLRGKKGGEGGLLNPDNKESEKTTPEERREKRGEEKKKGVSASFSLSGELQSEGGKGGTFSIF